MTSTSKVGSSGWGGVGGGMGAASGGMGVEGSRGVWLGCTCLLERADGGREGEDAG